MDLATLHEENHVDQTVLISQVFAPRYMTRSRVVAESTTSTDAHKLEDQDDVEPPLAMDNLKSEGNPITASEWETSSDTIAPSSEAIPTPTSQTDVVSVSSRKRGRHKEYTAPTGVWKTNGGYISTIYVGNRRIYGPLRDNPEEAGVDRQKLIEAKSFAKTEADMRSFIASLKGNTSSTTPIVQKKPRSHSVQSEESFTTTKRDRPMLTTCTSSTTILVSSP